jgi:drug/metabolite transporter (DMT)-like permease
MPRLALLLSTLVWGATFPATKVVLEQLLPFAFLSVRFLIGLSLGVAIALLWQGRLHADRLTLRLSAIASVFMFLGYALQTVGLRYTSASNSAFITALYVVLVPLLLRRYEMRTWLSALLAMLGLWLLVNPTLVPFAPTLTPSSDVLWGDLLTLASAFAFAAHIACLESYTRRTDAVSLFVWQLIVVTAAMAPAWWLEARLQAAAVAVWPVTPTVVVGLLVTGVLATGAFAVQIWAQRLLPAHRVALIFSLEPVVAAWLSWYFLGERLDATAWLGSALILTAVVLGTAWPRLRLGRSQREGIAAAGPDPARPVSGR